MISILVFLVIVGILLYLVNAILPMPQWVKQVINALAILFIFLYVLDVLGLYHTGVRRLR